MKYRKQNTPIQWT